jgi:hypothetical protein
MNDDENDSPKPFTITRRSMIGGMITLPVVGALGSCVRPQPVCATQPADPTRCQHRFCRYYRGQ